MDGSCQNIDPLVHTVETYDLGTQQTVSTLFKNHLHGHHLTAGIVPGMAHRGKNHRFYIQSSLSGIGFVDSGDCCCQIKYFDNAAALRTGIAAVSTADIICCNAALLVGWACQRDQRVFSGHRMLNLHRITHSKYIRHRGLHAVVDQDTALDTKCETGILCQLALGSNTNCQDHHIRVKGCGIPKEHIDSAVSFLKAFHSLSQGQMDAGFADFVMDKGGHIRIEGVHELLGALDDGDIHTKFSQVFRQFQTDKTTACKHDRFWMVFIDIFLDPEGVFHSPQGKQLLDTRSRQLWLGRFCTGRKEQFVIGLLENFSGFQVMDSDGLSFRVDGGDFVVYLHGDPEAFPETLRGLQGQVIRVYDNIADKIRQTAVCIGDVARTFKHDDLRLIIQSADSCSGGCTACDTANNDNFHNIRHPFWLLAELLLYRREPVHIRVRNEFCCLHANKKIGNGCKLDAVDVFQKRFGLGQLGMVQQNLSGTVERAIS